MQTNDSIYFNEAYHRDLKICAGLAQLGNSELRNHSNPPHPQADTGGGMEMVV